MPLHRKRQATRQSTKSAPPALRVDWRRSLDGVAALARGTTPRLTPLLASELLQSITMYKPDRDCL